MKVRKMTTITISHASPLSVKRRGWGEKEVVQHTGVHTVVMEGGAQSEK